MSFVFNGVSSDTMKFNVTSRQVYNAPAYDLNAIEVPGRSGDLLNPQNRFKNKQVSYTGFLKASDFEGSTWREKLSTGLIQLKGWLCSDAGQYHELTDDYDPGFTRYGYISGETAISDIEDRPFGVTLTVTFNCKPFMYKAGEPMELPETKSASGSIITITDGAENTPLKSAIVNIEPVQSGSGDPSPTNICPISGWSQVNMWQIGGNLLNYDAWKTVGVTRCTAVFENNGATLTATGTDGFTNFLNPNYPEEARIPVKVGVPITLSWDTPDTAVAANVYIFPNGDYAGNVYAAASFKKLTYTPTDGVTYITFRLGVTTNGTTVHYKNIMANFGTAAAAYTPFTGKRAIAIALGQTVYGATEDILRGKMVIDRVYANISQTYQANWGKSSAYPGGFYISLSTLASALGLPSLKNQTPFICSHAKTATTLAEYLPGTCFCDSSCNIRIMQASNTVNDWKAYLQAQEAAGTPVQAVFKLAAPIEVDLTPQTIKTLLGANNIWADAGEMSIEYPIPTENPYPFGSRPLYEITMAGTGTLVVNGKEWTITDYTGTLYCDTEAMEWYDASQLRNNIVSGDGWPVFEAGENSVSYTGDITKVMVTPRWRTL